MPRRIHIDRPPLGDILPESPLLIPPGFQLFNWVVNWRTSWSQVVAGKFSDSPYSGLFCYDRDNGFAAFYQTDGAGNLSLLQEYPGLPNSWTQVVAGVFDDSGYDGLLVYDPQSGVADVYHTDGGGSLDKLAENTCGTNWTHAVVAPFTDIRYSGVLLYDQSAGLGKIYSTNGHGGMTLLQEYDGWRTTWTHIVAGKFYGVPQGRDPNAMLADLFFFEGSTGYGETHYSDGMGGLPTLSSQSGFPLVSDVLAGNFGCLAWSTGGPQEWTNLLFFDRSSQSGTVFAIGDSQQPDGSFQSNAWLPVDTLSTGTPGSFPLRAERMRAPETAAIGLTRPPASPRWSLVVTGSFWMPDPEDKNFGTTGKYPQYRFFYNGGYTDLLFYDNAAGYAEFYLKESAQTTVLEPLAGYASSSSPFVDPPNEHSGSASPGEWLTFYVSSQVGPYRIDIYRQGASLVHVASVPVNPNAVRPYGVSRTAFRYGAGWPPVASLGITADWPSGLYLARVQAGGLPWQTGDGGVLESALSRTRPAPAPSSARPAPSTEPGISRISPFGNPVVVDIPFMVRSAAPGTQARILLAVADTTYEAYNYWGGRSMYGHSCKGVTVQGQPTINHVWVCDNFQLPRAFRISFQRPFVYVHPRYTRYQTFEVPLIQWLERHGFRADVCAVSDLHKYSDLLQNYRLFVSVGHDEYWSEEMRDNVEGFVANGGNAAFFSGNVCWWRVRFDGNTMVCYKNPGLDPETVEWGYLKRSSASMTGTTGDATWPNFPYDSPFDPNQYFVVAKDAGKHWIFDNTGLADNDTFGVYLRPDGVFGSVVGHETDTVGPNTPSTFQKLASAYQYNKDKNSLDEVGTMGVYETDNGGTVFTAATVNWVLGLSQDGTGGVIDQITWNVFNRLG